MLDDDTTITCNKLRSSSGGNNIPLYYLYVFKYGKPYYVHQFGFKFSSERDKMTNKENLRKIKDITLNTVFYKKIYKELKHNDFEKDEIYKFIGELKKYKSISEFLKNQKENDDCDLLFTFLIYLFSEYKLKYVFRSYYYKNLH